MTPCKPSAWLHSLQHALSRHERLLQALDSLLSNSEQQACASAHSVGPMSFD